MSAEPGATLAQAIKLSDAHAREIPTGPKTTVTKIVNAPSGDPRKGIYRISVFMPPKGPGLPEGLTFNQFLVVDDKPLLYHTGIKGFFPVVSAAVAKVLPVSDLQYIGYAHFEADECGSMNNFLEAAPAARPVCSQVEYMTNGNDQFLREPLGLPDGEELVLGEFTVQFLWAPHTPHGWGTGFLWEKSTHTLFAGDLFTQHGDPAPLQDAKHIKELNLKLWDITDYWVWHSKSAGHLARLADLTPSTLLVMHGSSFKGNACTDMLHQLSELRASYEPGGVQQVAAA